MADIKPVGSRWLFTPATAGYHAGDFGPEAVAIESYADASAPHHQSPTKHYAYIVGYRGVRFYANDESLSEVEVPA